MTNRQIEKLRSRQIGAIAEDPLAADRAAAHLWQGAIEHYLSCTKQNHFCNFCYRIKQAIRFAEEEDG